MFLISTKCEVVKAEILHFVQNDPPKGLLLEQRLFAALRVTARKCSVVKAEILHCVQNDSDLSP